MTFNTQDALAWAGDIPRGIITFLSSGSKQRKAIEKVGGTREQVYEAITAFEQDFVAFNADGDAEYILPDGYEWVDDGEEWGCDEQV